MLRVVLLEGITNALEAAHLKDKELQIWRELLEMSKDIGLLAGQAEALQKIANLESESNKNVEAIKDYAMAAELYRQLGNEARLDEVEISESVLLVNSSRGVEAVPLVEEIISYAGRALPSRGHVLKTPWDDLHLPASKLCRNYRRLERSGCAATRR
jgi:hypothetical protein